MKHLGLFEGIGGFSLAARWAAWETVAWCEWNEFGQRVLRHHFPKATGHGDITKTDFTIYRDRIDIITGGFPCQPYSLAGKRLGKEDERHLWPEMLRAIREVRPRWVVGENVLGLVNWSGGLVFDEVQADLEAEGYEVQPFILPACAVNAPHRRDRVWFVAYANGIGQGGRHEQHKPIEARQYIGCDSKNDVANTKGGRLQGQRGFAAIEGFAGKVESIRSDEGNSGNYATNANGRRQPRKEHGETKSEWITENGIPGDWSNFPTQPPIRSGDDGFSARLDGITFPKWRNESIKAYGNAIVPQAALQIFEAINEYERLTR